jgi:dTDP-4-amino-4,6-dideoxygalactose transaminase
MPGINAKMNEFQAAMGLLELEYVDKEINKRKLVHQKYVELLGSVPGISLPNKIENVDYNYSYFPILVDEKKARLSRSTLYNELKKFNVFSRKYFYPLCSNYPFFSSLPSASKDKLPMANKVAEEVLCLPIYGDLETEKVEIIYAIIRELLNRTN